MSNDFPIIPEDDKDDKCRFIVFELLSFYWLSIPFPPRVSTTIDVMHIADIATSDAMVIRF